MAIDTPSSLDLRRLSTAELRAERDRLQGLLDQAPRDRARELARASARRVEADQALERLTATNDQPAPGPGDASPAHGEPGRPAPTRGWWRWPASRPTGPTTAELQLRQHQQRRAGWLEANAHLGPAYRQVVRELAWQRRATGLAAEHDPPGYLAPRARPGA